MGAGASVDEGFTVDGELAKVLNASDNDLAKAADKLNRDIKRMVPKTASGRLDPASIKEDERESVLEVLFTGAAARRARLRQLVGVLQKDRGRRPGGAGRRRAARRNEVARRGLPRRAAAGRAYRRERPSTTS